MTTTLYGRDLNAETCVSLNPDLHLKAETRHCSPGHTWMCWAVSISLSVTWFCAGAAEPGFNPAHNPAHALYVSTNAVVVSL